MVAEKESFTTLFFYAPKIIFIFTGRPYNFIKTVFITKDFEKEENG